MSGNQPENNPDITKHREWLSQVRGTRIPEIMGAKPMPGLENVPLNGLVVSDDPADWTHIKQPLIPLTPALTNDGSAKRAAHELRMLRAELNSPDSFLTLIQDEQLGGQGQWALSIINSKELAFPEEQLREGMEASYSIGQTTLGSSSRAALLAITGKRVI